MSKLSLGVEPMLPALPDPEVSTEAAVWNAVRAVYAERDRIIEEAPLGWADDQRRQANAIEVFLRGTEAYPDAQRAARVLEMAVGRALGNGYKGGRGKLRPVGRSIEEHVRRETRAEYNGRDKIQPYLEDDGLSRAAALRIAKGGHVSANSGENEWYTPADYIEAARRVMGGIDLDPASSAEANEVIGAATFYIKEDDGLSLPWFGRVWMNPPYAQPLVGDFCERLSESVASDEIEQACVLVNNSTDTVFFQRMAEVAKAICFPSGRVKFWAPDKVAAPLQGQAVLYFGENTRGFCEDFAAFGFTVAVIG